jgi:hypothetical protein
MSFFRKRERGMTLVTSTVLLVAFIGIAALAIDAGMLYSARTSAQHAADAAALAGVYEFVNACNVETPPPGCSTWDLHEAAFNAGKRVAAQNKIFGTPVNIETRLDASPCPAPNLSTWLCVDDTNRRVTVNVARSGTLGIATFFARVLGFNSADIAAIATAEAGPEIGGTSSGNASYCLKPVFLPNTILAKNADGTPMAPGDACKPTASPSGPQVIFNTDGSLSAWAKASDPFGNPYLIRPTTPSVAKSGLAPSQFYSLDYGNGTDPVTGEPIGGADMYRCTLGRCANQCGVPDLLACSSSSTVNVVDIDVETGNMVGPTWQGIDTLIGTSDIDTFDAWKTRLSTDGTATSRNLVVAPIWDTCNQPVRSGTNVDIHVLGFVKVFVDSVVHPSDGGGQAGDITAHVLGPITCSDMEGGGGTPPTPGPYTIPIRLVQSPTTAKTP